MNTYIDVFDFTRSTSGLEWQSLVGNMARFTSTQSMGATSLTVPASSVTVPLAQFDRLTIFDGTSSEVVQVGAAGASVGATSIPLITGLQFAHASGIAWSSDGTGGSLADQIVAASSWCEQTAYQPFLQTTWTDESLSMPSMRAAIANDGMLTFRPRHWPVNTVSALKVAFTQSLATTYDATQVMIDGDQRLCLVPNLIQFPAQQTSNSIPPPPTRSMTCKLILTYQAGYTYAALPGDLKEAVILVASDYVARRHNPIGAPDLADGSTRISAIIRGQKTGESLLIARARVSLEKYSVKLF